MVRDENQVRSLFRIEGQEIQKLASSIDTVQVDALIRSIAEQRGNIFLTGCGTSAMVAQKAVHTLRVVNIPAFFLNPSDAVHGALGAVTSSDIVIFISKGGNTKELISFLPNLREKQVEIISVTEDQRSTLGQDADLVVTIKVSRELDEFDMLATISSMSVIALFDVVAVELMQEEHFTEKQFLVNHPSGAVGEKLREDTHG
ncbi:KpsF/GutQ family sugar-phosphate isomerase [Lacticaseibacillus zeae]|uniref:SIS domain-containing protein n=1 Tax=Lacticaseibacillus zeae TaxID=57037 RepID=A0A5R8LYB4_LACZE|nr:SIS domain-containing protein [Lacticaseibacillus zeae]TLF42392.1 SIS domain-containing protein [Lacticaseibacillus zeae]